MFEGGKVLVRRHVLLIELLGPVLAPLGRHLQAEQVFGTYRLSFLDPLITFLLDRLNFARSDLHETGLPRNLVVLPP